MTEQTNTASTAIQSGFPENYADANSKIVDQWVADGWEWGQPVSHELIEKARHGDWGVGLATRVVPYEWFEPYIDRETHLFPFAPNIAKTKILGLAAGGGQQSAILSAAGAAVTVFDYSDSQLNSDRTVAEREGFTDEEFIKGDMSKPLPFADESFDIIVNPVSNIFIEDVRALWRECYRVLRKGGLLLAGLDNGFQYLFDDGEDGNPDMSRITWTLPVNLLKNPEQRERWNVPDWGIQFSHTFEEQVGGQCDAGFVITQLRDAFYTDAERKLGFPTSSQTRAVKM